MHMMCDQHGTCTLRCGTAAVKCILAVPPPNPVFDTSFDSIQRALCPHSTLKGQFYGLALPDLKTFWFVHLCKTLFSGHWTAL